MPERGSSDAELAQGARVAGPVPLHLHEELEEEPTPEKRFEVLPRALPDVPDARPALADQDPLLRIAFDEDRRLHDDEVAVRFFRPRLDDDGGAVGDLGLGELVDLLADALGGDRARRLVRELVFRIEGGAGRQDRRDRARELRQVLPGSRAHRHEVALRVALVQGGVEGEEIRPRHPVDLVQGDEPAVAARADDLQNLLVVGAEAVGGIEQHEHRVGLADRAPGGVDHSLVEEASRPVNSGKVDPEELGPGDRLDPEHAKPGRLRAFALDRHLGAQHAVEERRLADVRTAGERDRSAAKFRIYRPPSLCYLHGLSMLPWKRVSFLLAVLVLLAGFLRPVAAAAEDEGFLDRAAGAVGRATGAVGGLVLDIVELIVPTARRDDDLDRALETYARGHYFTTWFVARRLLEKKEVTWLADEASFLAGLAAADAGVTEEAVPRLTAVLDADPVSPYYAVALARLLELAEKNGHDDEAARIAATYLADFWKRPRSPREAAIKGVFLESGNFSEDLTRADDGSASGNRAIDRYPERTTDRAVYLAGLALLRAKDFERAAVCLDALAPTSTYYSYARYGYAQASYGSHDTRRARAALSEILSHPGQRAGEVYLRDRAALLSAQILNELGEHGAAIRRLRLVADDGPFALHAAILAAEIQADREETALALVYLKDRPSEGVEPKLVAQAAALDAELHRELADTTTAIARLEEGIGVLDRYEASLRAVDGRLDSLLRPLETRSRSRLRIEAWRRENVSNAVPDLLEGRAGAGWGARVVAGLVAGNPGEDGYPVVYHRRAFDPFAALPMPRDREEFEPPGDHAFPSLFRHSLGEALSDAFRHDLAMRAALEEDDPVQLAMLALDGELRLRAAAPVAGDVDTRRRLRALGFGDALIAGVEASRPRSQVLAEAIGSFAAGERDFEVLRAEARQHLARWGEHLRGLVRETVDAEVRAVQELRYALEFELSQTLATRREQDDRLLRGAAPTSSLSSPPAG